MDQLVYRVATETDIPFIHEVYTENIDRLHGALRSADAWRAQLTRKDCTHYVVQGQAPVAWFRIDAEEDGFWLGMLQVKPVFQRCGIGRYVLSVAEATAKEQGCHAIGIHTTEDNTVARAFYLSAGYAVTEIGPCTTADGVDRVGYTFRKEL